MMKPSAFVLVSFGLVSCVAPPERGGGEEEARHEGETEAAGEPEAGSVSASSDPQPDEGEGPCAKPGELPGPRNSELANLGTMRLLEAVPAERGDWKRISREAAAADGETRWSDAVQAVVDDGRRRATISITDMKSLCEVGPGLGETMLDRALSERKGEPTKVADRFGIAFEEGAYKLVNFWSGDRCAITIGAPALSHADLVDVAGALDLEALDGMCSQRTGV